MNLEPDEGFEFTGRHAPRSPAVIHKMHPAWVPVETLTLAIRGTEHPPTQHAAPHHPPPQQGPPVDPQVPLAVPLQAKPADVPCFQDFLQRGYPQTWPIPQEYGLKDFMLVRTPIL